MIIIKNTLGYTKGSDHIHTSAIGQSGSIMSSQHSASGIQVADGVSFLLYLLQGIYSDAIVQVRLVVKDRCAYPLHSISGSCDIQIEYRFIHTFIIGLQTITGERTCSQYKIRGLQTLIRQE